MSTALSPIVSEFETEEQAASHDLWFRAKVQSSRDDPRPSVPHDEAMAHIRKRLDNKLANQEEAATGQHSRDY